MLSKDLKKNIKLSKINLTDTDKNVAEHFSKYNDIVVTKAVKGWAIVILDGKDYIAKANEHLQDNSFYQKLNEDLTAKHCRNCQESYRKFQ